MERLELREISIESRLRCQASRRPKPTSQAEDGDTTNAICQSADDKQNKTVADGSHAWQDDGRWWEAKGSKFHGSQSLTDFSNEIQTTLPFFKHLKAVSGEGNNQSTQ